MRIKSGFVLRNVKGQNVIVQLGKRNDFNSTITLTDTTAFIWKEIVENESDEQNLVNALVNKFSVSTEAATSDVSVFVGVLKEHGILE